VKKRQKLRDKGGKSQIAGLRTQNRPRHEMDRFYRKAKLIFSMILDFFDDQVYVKSISVVVVIFGAVNVIG
jgi:hypothetical protein